jgi:hypothetical protein
VIRDVYRSALRTGGRKPHNDEEVAAIMVADLELSADSLDSPSHNGKAQAAMTPLLQSA